MVSIKKKQSKKKGKQSQKQQQTVIVNIDKRRRARNINQELLKSQQQKLQQLQAITQMRDPQFQDLNIKIKDLEKKKTNASNDLLQIKNTLELLKERSNQLISEPTREPTREPKEEEEEELPGNIIIPPNKKFKGIIVQNKKRLTPITVNRANEFITNLGQIPEELIDEIEILRGSIPRVTTKLKSFIRENRKSKPIIQVEELREKSIKK